MQASGYILDLSVCVARVLSGVHMVHEASSDS